MSSSKVQAITMSIYQEHQRIDAFELWCWRKLLTVPLDCKEVKLVNPEGNQSWICIGGTDAEAETPNWSLQLVTWCEEPTHWKRPWCWENLRAGGEGDDRGWDGWMASLIQWTWVWASSRRWWRTGKHTLQSMGSQSQTWLSVWTTTITFTRNATVSGRVVARKQEGQDL